MALGRKTALFAGSDGGADGWAIVASLIETAKLNGVEPFAWLRDALTRMVEGHPAQALDELLPWSAAAWQLRWRPSGDLSFAVKRSSEATRVASKAEVDRDTPDDPIGLEAAIAPK